MTSSSRSALYWNGADLDLVATGPHRIGTFELLEARRFAGSSWAAGLGFAGEAWSRASTSSGERRPEVALTIAVAETQRQMLKMQGDTGAEGEHGVGGSGHVRSMEATQSLFGEENEGVVEWFQKRRLEEYRESASRAAMTGTGAAATRSNSMATGVTQQPMASSRSGRGMESNEVVSLVEGRARLRPELVNNSPQRSPEGAGGAPMRRGPANTAKALPSGVTPGVGLSRVDYTNGVPNAAVVAPEVSATWSSSGGETEWFGQIRASGSGATYLLGSGTSADMTLWVNGIEVQSSNAAINMVSDQLYDIRIRGVSTGAAAIGVLKWRTPGQSAFVPVPTGSLYPPKRGQGLGLASTYYTGLNFAGTATFGQDQAINFQTRPAQSARWTGEIQPTFDGVYELDFAGPGDQYPGVALVVGRVWVNDRLAYDYTAGAQEPIKNEISLRAGERYDLRVEYLGGSAPKLVWKSDRQPTQIIPTSQLFPTTGVVPRVSGTPSAAADGIYTLNLATTGSAGSSFEYWSIDWGDGTVERVKGTATSATHRYADQNALYVVVASAVQSDGSRTSATPSVEAVYGTGQSSMALPTGFELLSTKRDSTGRIVLAGRVNKKTGTSSVHVMRLTAAGLADTSFGPGGMKSYPLENEIKAEAVEFADDLGFFVLTRSSSNVSVTRYSESGAVDSSFGVNGTATSAGLFQSSHLAAAGWQLRLRRSGSDYLPVAGGGITETTDTTLQPALARLVLWNATGTTSTGVAIQRAPQPEDDPEVGWLPGSMRVTSLAVSGMDVVAGVDRNTLAIRSSAGVLTTTAYPDGFDSVTAETIANGGFRMYVATGSNDVRLRRLSSSFVGDTAFGISGVASAGVQGIATVQSVAVAADGKLVVTGTTRGSGAGGATSVSRFESNGRIDGSWGIGGTEITEFGANNLSLVYPDGGVMLAANDNGTLALRKLRPTNAIRSSTRPTSGISSIQVAETTTSSVTLSYSSIWPSNDVSLEMVGPGDLNYRVVGGFLASPSGIGSFTVNGLTPGQYYSFRLVSVNGAAVDSATAFTMTPEDGSALLSPPTALVAAVGGSPSQRGVSFGWQPTAAAIAAGTFNVQLRSYSTRTPLVVFNREARVHSLSVNTSSGGTNNVFTVLPGLLATDEHVLVRVGDGTGWSRWAPLRSMDTAPVPGGPRIEMVLSVADGGSVGVSFSRPFWGQLIGVTSNGAQTLLQSIAGASDLTLTSTQIPAGVRSLIAISGDEASANIQLPTLSIAKPAKITGLKVITLPGGGRLLQWGGVGSGESGFVVERSESKADNSSWRELAQLPADTRSYVDTSPDAASVNSYRVRVRSAAGLSDPSEQRLNWHAPLISGIPVGQTPGVKGVPQEFSMSALSSSTSVTSLTYSWKIESESNPSEIQTIVTTSPNLTYLPTGAGNWRISAEVTDASTATTSSTKKERFVVVDAAPGTIVGPTTSAEGEELEYVAAGTDLNPVWTVTTGAGFGQTVLTGSVGQRFKFQPPSPGTYRVSVTGGSSPVDVVVRAIKPDVMISGEPRIVAGRSALFEAVPDGPLSQSGRLGFQWSLLDQGGSPVGAGVFGPLGPHPTTLGSYLVPGSLAVGRYSVQVSVTDPAEPTNGVVVRRFDFEVVAKPESATFEYSVLATAIDNEKSVQAGGYDNIRVTSHVVQADGKIVVVGFTHGDSQADTMEVGRSRGFVTRLNPDLSLDQSFGPNRSGTVTFDIQGGGVDHVRHIDLSYGTELYGVALDPLTGNIVVTGAARAQVQRSDSNSVIAPSLMVARLLAEPTLHPSGNGVLSAGMLDPTFNQTVGPQANPTLSWEPLVMTSKTTMSAGFDVVVLADGSILVGGTALTPARGAAINDIRTSLQGLNSSIFDPQQSHKIPLVDDFLLVKINPLGKLDTSFGQNGVAPQLKVTTLDAQTPFAPANPAIGDVELMPTEQDGLSTLVGGVGVGLWVRGPVTALSTLNGVNSAVKRIKVLPEGEIVVVGHANRLVLESNNQRTAEGVNTGVVVAKFTSTGQLDIGSTTAPVKPGFGDVATTPSSAPKTGWTFTSSESLDGNSTSQKGGIFPGAVHIENNGNITVAATGASWQAMRGANNTPGNWDLNGSAKVVILRYQSNGFLPAGADGLTETGVIDAPVGLRELNDNGSIDQPEAGMQNYFHMETNSLAFGPNGELYASVDPVDPLSPPEPGRWKIVRIDRVSGQVDTSFLHQPVGGSGTAPVAVGVPGTAVWSDGSRWGSRTLTSQRRSGALAVGPDGVTVLGEIRARDGALQGRYGWSNLPTVVRYRTTDRLSVGSFTAAAVSPTRATLSWRPTGTGIEGYEVRRASTPGGTGQPGSAIAQLRADQTEFSDPGLVESADRYYTVVPFGTSTSGYRDYGSPSPEVPVRPLGLLSTGRLVATLEVPLDGTVVQTTEALESGRRYVIDAVGSIPLKGGSVADTLGWQSANDPLLRGTSLAGASTGIRVTRSGAPSTPISVNWTRTDVTASNSSPRSGFVAEYIGSNDSIRFGMDARFSSANAIDQIVSPVPKIIVRIYDTQSLPNAGPIHTVYRIVGVGEIATRERFVVDRVTPVEIIAARSDGAATSWSLALKSPSGEVYSLAASSSAAGTLPARAARVASIDPTRLPNGNYTLELREGTELRDSAAISIATAAKSGSLSFTMVDASVQTPVGPITIGRTYESVEAGQSGTMGKGWRATFLDAQLHTTAGLDPIDTTGQGRILRAGDLVYLTLPGSGRHVFQFAPVPTNTDLAGSEPSTGTEYAIRFNSIDGSGATLVMSDVNAVSGEQDFNQIPLRYSPQDDAYYAYTGTNINGSQARRAFGPAENVFGNKYVITTREGLTYDIDATTGAIDAIRTHAGNSVTFTRNLAGTQVTARSGDARRLFEVMLTQGRVTSVVIPDDGAIQYRYDSLGNLAEVENQAGDVSRYRYQDPLYPSHLTSIIDPFGEVTSTVEYDSAGRLSAIGNTDGVKASAASQSLGSGKVISTQMDPAGVVTERVIDTRTGAILRSVTTNKSNGSVVSYRVSMSGFEYVGGVPAGAITGGSRPGSAPGLKQVLHALEYPTFDVSAADAGARFSAVPAGIQWTKKITFDTTSRVGDPSRSKATSIAERVGDDGTIKTALLSDYRTYYRGAARLPVSKPNRVVETLTVPNAGAPGGFSTHVTKTQFATYNEAGDPVYSLTAVGPDPADPARFLVEGVKIEYTTDEGVPKGLPKQQERIAGSFLPSTIQANGSLGTGAFVGDPTVINSQSKTYYYTAGDHYLSPTEGLKGGVYGAPYLTVNEKSQQTFHAYDSSGREVLNFVFKKWTHTPPNQEAGDLDKEDGWVGTISVYDDLGLLTEQYAATYDETRGGQLDGFALPEVALGGPAGVQITEPLYLDQAPVLMVKNEYDTQRRQSVVTDRFGGQTRYTYDSAGRVIRTVNPDGTEVRNVYDSAGRLVWATDPFRDYDPSYGLGPVPLPVATQTVYDGLNQVVETRRYNQVNITFSPVQRGSVSTLTTSATGGTLISADKSWYDSRGRVIQTTDAAGIRYGTLYHPSGEVSLSGPLKTTAPNGGNVTVSGGIISRTFSTTDFVYFSTSSPARFSTTLGQAFSRTTDPRGYSTDTYVDPLDRPTRTVFADGTSVQTLYGFGKNPVAGHQIAGVNIDGRQETQIDPMGQATQYFYNRFDQLVQVRQPAVVPAPGQPAVSPVTEYAYDLSGNRKLQRDALGRETAFQFDEHDNEIRQTLPSLTGAPVATGPSRTARYDRFSRVVVEQDFKGNQTYYGYDDTGFSQGRLASRHHFAAGVSATDTTTGVVNASLAEQEVIYRYDALSRPAVIDHRDGTLQQQSTFAYDSISGQLTSASSPEGTIQYAYDSADRLIRTFTAFTEVNYGYDSLGRLQTVGTTKLNGTSHAASVVATYGYDAAGNKVSEVLGNGVSTTYTYDNLNRLTNLVTVSGGGGGLQLLSQTYTLRADSRRTAVAETWRTAGGTSVSRTATYAYDPAGRLTSETVTSPVAAQAYTDTYTLDLVGNRVKKVHTGQGAGQADTTNLTYDAHDRLITAVSSLTGTTLYGYDANGSLTSETVGGVGKVYTYDARNDLRSLSVGGVVQAEYGYDDGDNRVRVVSGGITGLQLTDTQSLTGFAQVLEVRTPGMNVAAHTYVAGDRVVRQWDGDGVSEYLMADGGGSTRLTTRPDGVVTKNLTFDAFGTAIGFNPSTAGTPHLFGGDATLDAPSDMYLHGNGVRYRAGAVFTQRDTYAGQTNDPVSLHKYLYGNADPMTNRDPTGYWSVNEDNPADSTSEIYDVAKLAVRSMDWNVGGSLADQAFALAEMHAYSWAVQGVALQAEIQSKAYQVYTEMMFGFLVGGMMSRACFTSGTQVVVGMNADGSYITRSIEELRVGDLVLSRSEREVGDELELKPITHLSRKQSEHVRTVRIRDGEAGRGGGEEIKTTDDHPFYVVGVGWVLARDLRPGDRLVEADGSDDALVEWSLREDHYAGIEVFNFEVAGDHTYFVGDGRGEVDVAVWVHNVRACNFEDVAKAQHIFGTNLAKHKLGGLLSTYGGDMIAATTAISKAVQGLAAGEHMITLNGITIVVRCTIVNGVTRVGTAFIK